MSIYVRPDLEGMTVAAIKEFCRDREITGYSRYTRKASLIEFVEAAMLEKFLEEDLLEAPTEELEGDEGEKSEEAIGTSEYVPCPFCESAKAAGKFCDWCDGTGVALSPFTTQGEPQGDRNPEVEEMFHLEEQVSEAQRDRNPEVEGMFHLESEVSERQCDRNPEVEGMFHLKQLVSERQRDRNSQLTPPEPEIKRRLEKNLSVFKNRIETQCCCLGSEFLVMYGCKGAMTLKGGHRYGI